MATSINYSYPSSSYSYSNVSNSGNINPGVIFGIFSSLYAVFLLVFLIILVSNWKIFSKAGKPGWASLVPIYNLVIMLRIACMPEWMIILFFLPLVNAFIGLVVQVKMIKAFGKSTGFIIGYFFLPLIFLPILAFDSSQYIGDGTNSTVTPPQPSTPPQAPNTNQNPIQPQTINPPTTVLPPVQPPTSPTISSSVPPQTPTINI